MWEPQPRIGPKTLADWLALPEDARFELIDGEFVEKAAPTFEHGMAQGSVLERVRRAYNRKPGSPHGPGGWWIAGEVDILLDERVYRPDVAGWRRERMPAHANERPLALRPDWICEIVSDSNRATDRVKKLRRYHQAAVPHYWILDQPERTLTVHRHAEAGYLVVLAAEATDRVRAEPFGEIELRVGVLLGDDDDD